MLDLPLQPGQSANLLSLDGGGVKGISTLVILNAIMEQVKKVEKEKNWNNSDDARNPVDYFHLAAGTSTGGIIALMLFRLRMSIKDTIKEYEKIGPTVFGPDAVASSGSSKFLAAPLEAAIDDIVKRYDAATKILIEKAKLAKKGKELPIPEPLLVDNIAKMFMCATLRGRGESVLLRSYDMPDAADPVSQEGIDLVQSNAISKMTIKTAARATSAAPTYFPVVQLKIDGKPGKTVDFWDGGLLNNNPIDQLWRARLDLAKPKEPPPKVACILSLGTSWSTAGKPTFFTKFGKFRSGVELAWKVFCNVPGVSTLVGWIDPAKESVEFLTNTEAKHLDFRRWNNRMLDRSGTTESGAKYFRFNTPTDNLYIDMADAAKMGQLKALTQEWVEKGAKTYIEEVAMILAKKPPGK